MRCISRATRTCRSLGQLLLDRFAVIVLHRRKKGRSCYAPRDLRSKQSPPAFDASGWTQRGDQQFIGFRTHCTAEQRAGSTLRRSQARRRPAGGRRAVPASIGRSDRRIRHAERAPARTASGQQEPSEDGCGFRCSATSRTWPPAQESRGRGASPARPAPQDGGGVALLDDVLRTNRGQFAGAVGALLHCANSARKADYSIGALTDA